MLYRKPNAMTAGTIAQRTAARVAGPTAGPVAAPMGWGGEGTMPPPPSMLNFLINSGRGYMPNRPGWQNMYGSGQLQSNAGSSSGGSTIGGQAGGVDYAGGTAGFYGPGGGGNVGNQPRIGGGQYPNTGTGGTVGGGNTGYVGGGNYFQGGGGTAGGGSMITDVPQGGGRASAAGPMAGITNPYAMSGGSAPQGAGFQVPNSTGTASSVPGTAESVDVPLSGSPVYQPPIAAAPTSIWGGAKRGNTMGYGNMDPNAPYVPPDRSAYKQTPTVNTNPRQGAASQATPNVLGNAAGATYAAKGKQKATSRKLQKNSQYPTYTAPVGTIKAGEMAQGQALLEKQQRLPQLQESLRQGQITQEQYDQQVAKWDADIAAAKQNVQALAGGTTPMGGSESNPYVVGPGREISRGGPGNSAEDVLYRSQQTAANRGNALMGSGARQVFPTGSQGSTEETPGGMWGTPAGSVWDSGTGTWVPAGGAEGEPITDTPLGSISPGIGGSRVSYDPNTGQGTAEYNPSVGSVHDPGTGLNNQINFYNSIGAGNQSGIRGGFGGQAVGPGQSGSSGNATGGSSGWDLGDYSTGNDDLDKLLRMWQQAYDKANAANEARYGEIKQGYGDLYKNATDYFNQNAANLLSGYGERYDRNMGYIGDYGKQQAEDLTAQYQQARGQEEQDLINRGLGNTTVRSGVMRGLTESEADSQARLQEALTRMKMGYDTTLSGDTLAAQQAMLGLGLGLETGIPQNQLDFMERRNDVAPDLAQALQLAMMSGNASGATQPGIGGPGQPVMPNPGGGGNPYFPGGGGYGNQGPGGHGPIGDPGGGYGGHGQVDPVSGLPKWGPQQGDSNPVRKGKDGKTYRWNPSTGKWEPTNPQDAANSNMSLDDWMQWMIDNGYSPNPADYFAQNPPKQNPMGADMPDPNNPILREAQANSMDVNSVNPYGESYPGGVLQPSSINDVDPRLLEQWANNPYAMLNPPR